MNKEEIFKNLTDIKIFNKRGYINYFILNSLEKNHPYLYSELINTSPFTQDIKEKMYLLNHERGKCVLCNHPTRFISYTKGYQKTCSKECFNKLIGNNTSKNQKGKSKPKEVFEKMKETRKKNNSIEKITNSLKITNLEKYGVTSYFKTPEFKRKALTTLQQKWGTNMDIDYLYTLDYDMAKHLIFIFSKTKERIPSTIEPLFNYKEYKGVYSSKEERGQGATYFRYYFFKCLICGSAFEDYMANGHTPECPVCNPPIDSKGEKFLRELFTLKNIEFERQKTFPNLLGLKKKPLKFDFYLPEYNACIEYQGIQHYFPFEHFGGKETFKKQILRDQIKRSYCKENKINLIEIKYDIPFKDIENYLENELNSLSNKIT